MFLVRCTNAEFALGGLNRPTGGTIGLRSLVPNLESMYLGKSAEQCSMCGDLVLLAGSLCLLLEAGLVLRERFHVNDFWWDSAVRPWLIELRHCQY